MAFLKTFLPESLVQFIRRRLDRSHFYGLTLTLLFAAVICLFLLLFGMIQQVIASNLIIAMDARVASLLFDFRDTELIKFFIWITVSAEWQIVLAFAIVCPIILFLWKKITYLLPFWIALAGSELFTYLLKSWVHRIRPPDAIFLESSFSFPSGHASMGLVFYGFLAFFLLRLIKKWEHKIAVLFFSSVLILMIGVSRLYFGVHFLSDVLGGYLLGAFWLLIGIAIFQCLDR